MEKTQSPKAPPFLALNARLSSCLIHPMALESTRAFWDQLFAKGYRADVCVHTETGNIRVHASILGMVSPVLKQLLRQSKSRCGRKKSISICGVPHGAVWAFLRFLYSSCYEVEEMNKFVLHLFVLSHTFGIASLKEVCVQQLEKGLLTVENVVDVYQLAELCDAPRLSLFCHRMIIREFQAVSETEGWTVMRQSNPRLEKDLLKLVGEADSMSIIHYYFNFCR